MTTSGQYYEVSTETVGTVKTILSTPHHYGFQGLRDVAVSMFSNGPATFTHGVVEFSPDGVIWGTLDATTFANIGSASFLYGKYNIPNFRLRMIGAVASGSMAVATTFFIHP